MFIGFEVSRPLLHASCPAGGTQGYTRPCSLLLPTHRQKNIEWKHMLRSFSFRYIFSGGSCRMPDTMVRTVCSCLQTCSSKQHACKREKKRTPLKIVSPYQSHLYVKSVGNTSWAKIVRERTDYRYLLCCSPGVCCCSTSAWQ